MSKIRALKEGKEPSQGAGYLDDVTMLVIGERPLRSEIIILGKTMISNDSDAALHKHGIIERLDELSVSQLKAVETFLNELLAGTLSESLSTHKEASFEPAHDSEGSHESINPDWSTWQAIFDEADQLPSSEPAEVGLSKQQRREVISADLERKLDNMSKTHQKNAV